LFKKAKFNFELILIKGQCACLIFKSFSLSKKSSVPLLGVDRVWIQWRTLKITIMQDILHPVLCVLESTPTSRLLSIHLSDALDSFLQAKVARGYDMVCICLNSKYD
jgi:hypothetical protein